MLIRLADLARSLVIIYILYVLVSGPLYDSPELALGITAFLVAASTLLTRTRLIRSVLDRALLDEEARPGDELLPTNARLRWAYPLAGVIVLAGCFVMLELRQPFFFTQDDNFSCNLPVMLLGCRSAIHGVFCTWNPYQLLGCPTSTIPQSQMSYVPVYISYLAARYLLGNEYLTIEVLVMAHILVAYLGTYWLTRSLGMRPILALAASLSMALSGFSLIVGRSWCNVLCTTVWAVFLAASLVRLRKGPVYWKWILFTGAVIGISFHAGYAQQWAYSLVFFLAGTVILAACRSIPWHRCLRTVPALLVGLAIAAPLLLPQVLETHRLQSGRLGGYGQGIQQGSQCLMLPYPIAKAGENPEEGHLAGYGPVGMGSTNYEFMGEYYYSGTLFYALATVMFLAAIAYPWRRRVVAANIWLILAGLVLMFALGHRGLLWTLATKLPFFSKFTGPFKFLGLLNLFVIMGAGLGFERVLRRLRHGQALAVATSAVAVALLVYHSSLPLPAFYNYGDRLYPRMPSAVTKRMASERRYPQRAFGIAPGVSPAPGFALSLVRNFATAYGVPSFDGYDPLVAVTPENRGAAVVMSRNPIAACQAYGVRWIVLHRLAVEPVLGPNQRLNPDETAVDPYVTIINGQAMPVTTLLSKSLLVLTLPQVALFEVLNVAPMAFPQGRPDQALPVRFDGAGAQVELSDTPDGGPIIVNVLMRPWITAQADGIRLKAQPDNWGRVRVDVPPRSRMLNVRYSPPWKLGFLCAGILALLAGVSVLLIRPEPRSP